MPDETIPPKDKPDKVLAIREESLSELPSLPGPKTEKDRSFSDIDRKFDEDTHDSIVKGSFNRRLIPIRTATVGRSVKLRDLFTLSGAVASDSTVVTVTAAGSSGAQTDLKSFMFFPNEWHVGMLVRITALGVITDDGTRVCKLSLGSGLAASHTEWNSMTSTSATVTNSPWSLTWYGIVTTIGASGTLEAQMKGDINRVNKDDPNTAAVALATNTAITVALTADWDGTDAGNSISIRQWIVEILY